MTAYCSIDDMLFVLPNCNQDLMASVIESTSRAIDKTCNRVFFQTVGNKSFDINCNTVVLIDDFTPDTNTKVYVDDVLLTATQYEFLPLNGNPKTSIKLLNVSGDRLKITGTWGYGSVPEQVKNATMFLSRLTYQSILEKQTKAETIAGYTVTYADTLEQYPSSAIINQFVGQFKKVKAYR